MLTLNTLARLPFQPLNVGGKVPELRRNALTMKIGRQDLRFVSIHLETDES